ncbi:hypothetical protein GTQ40_01090 [Flavobacteriaceae bacterium R38]|nr:hypothetical protein [Flavobacteriaceae bacterium R38]
MKTISIFILTAFLVIFNLKAQDYNKQFDAFQKAVQAKNSQALQPFISTEMSIPSLLTKEQLRPELLEQIFADVFKRIDKVILKEYNANEIVVFYDFKDEKTKDRSSSIILDPKGKIKEIKIIAELIKEEREKTASKDAEQPIADEFTKKYPAKKVEFKTPDDRVIVGNLYDIGINKPVILLGHQAGSNKYEYADIAPKLNEMGYNALAIDLSGGGKFAAHDNETLGRGTDVGNDRGLIQRRTGQEINVAVDYLFKKYNQKVIIWGSSLSANFAILVASRNENTKAVISFSGLASQLSRVIPQIKEPIFMTSSLEEVPRVNQLLKDNSKENVTHFIPKGEGDHGSRVLWNGQPYAEEYWVAVKAFLNKLK